MEPSLVVAPTFMEYFVTGVISAVDAFLTLSVESKFTPSNNIKIKFALNFVSVMVVPLLHFRIRFLFYDILVCCVVSQYIDIYSKEERPKVLTTHLKTVNLIFVKYIDYAHVSNFCATQ